MGAVSLRGVSKSFGSASVLQSINLDIADGEFLTLLGPSGCGKSTLLRIIAGLETASSGQVFIGDRNVDRVPPKERDVAMVFQSYALYPHLSVRGNMALPLRMRRLSAAQRLPAIGRHLPGARERLRRIDAEVDGVAKVLGLDDLLDRRPAQLSGGQRQRVALGRAMVRHPSVFLMDEPLSNLDAERRTAMRAELAALHRRLGTTFIYVTHDQVEAMTLSSRIAVMERGAILQLGTPQQIYDAPADTRVAAFVGLPKINLLPARARAGRLILDDLPLDGVKASHIDGDCTIGVRPEALRISAQPEGALAVTVSAIEHLGSELHISCTTRRGQALLVRCPVSGGRALGPGAPVHLAFDPQSLHLFDASGARVPLLSGPQSRAAAL